MNYPPKKVAVVERFKQESVYELSTKKVAVVRGLNKSRCMNYPPKKWLL